MKIKTHPVTCQRIWSLQKERLIKGTKILHQRIRVSVNIFNQVLRDALKYIISNFGVDTDIKTDDSKISVATKSKKLAKRVFFVSVN